MDDFLSIFANDSDLLLVEWPPGSLNSFKSSKQYRVNLSIKSSLWLSLLSYFFISGPVGENYWGLLAKPWNKLTVFSYELDI